MTTAPAASRAAAVAAARPRTRPYLMCPPDHFRVDYAINPWMTGDPVDAGLARRQWDGLVAALRDLGHHVTLMPADPDLPDLVFTANGGLVVGDRAMAPRFRHGERRGEEELYARALAGLGVREVAVPRHVNEGEGDVRLVGGTLLLGTGFRSDPRTAGELRDFFGLPVEPLRLVDPRFYHLDTALAVLGDDAVAYWPGAFDARSLDLLRTRWPDAVIASEDDAAGFGLNLVCDGATVVMPDAAPALAARLRERGFDVVALPMTEFRKSGGGPKCCVLDLHPEPKEEVRDA